YPVPRRPLSPRPDRPLPLLCRLPRAAHHRALPSFPTRRSSDLASSQNIEFDHENHSRVNVVGSSTWTPSCIIPVPPSVRMSWCRDRKSTRLNSSHVSTSYAVFCLQKKT